MQWKKAHTKIGKLLNELSQQPNEFDESNLVVDCRSTHENSNVYSYRLYSLSVAKLVVIYSFAMFVVNGLLNPHYETRKFHISAGFGFYCSTVSNGIIFCFFIVYCCFLWCLLLPRGVIIWSLAIIMSSQWICVGLIDCGRYHFWWWRRRWSMVKKNMHGFQC